jgi:hypothetical protein
VRVAAQEWAREPEDRVRDRIRRRLGVRGGAGGLLCLAGVPRNGSGGARIRKTEEKREG